MKKYILLLSMSLCNAAQADNLEILNYTPVLMSNGFYALKVEYPNGAIKYRDMWAYFSRNEEVEQIEISQTNSRNAEKYTGSLEYINYCIKRIHERSKPTTILNEITH